MRSTSLGRVPFRSEERDDSPESVADRTSLHSSTASRSLKSCIRSSPSLKHAQSEGSLAGLMKKMRSRSEGNSEDAAALSRRSSQELRFSWANHVQKIGKSTPSFPPIAE